MERGFAIYETPVGWMRVEYENGNITRLGKIVDEPEDKGSRTALTDEVDRQLREYFDGKRKEFEFPYEMKGTVFQKSVWRALCAIPYGETRSYKDIAVVVGNAKASRAVGMANNKNPIAIVVPCHRVIGADGKLVGYASGLEMKEALLKLEAENK
ncbi:MAG: methylated-DNA--[protein]-cysteine S-methyltransferase [Eubacteriaceae bacterium]|nr:methylated-DNA--[protein]-cysteine S-methyltransferase [Eubacteriaceae bacterium]